MLYVLRKFERNRMSPWGVISEFPHPLRGGPDTVRDLITSTLTNDSFLQLQGQHVHTLARRQVPLYRRV